MKWCTLNWDKKGLFVYWGWCSDYIGESYDYDCDDGVSYHLNIPFDWWAKSWEDNKDNWEYVYHPIILPWFIAYIFLGIPTIIDKIKEHKKYAKLRERGVNLNECF